MYIVCTVHVHQSAGKRKTERECERQRERGRENERWRGERAQLKFNPKLLHLSGVCGDGGSVYSARLNEAGGG